MSHFDQCSLSSMLHTHDHLEKAPYHHFMTILHHKFVVSKPIDQTKHLVSVQNAHFLFRTGHLHVHDSVVWNSSSKNYSVLSSLNKNHSNWYEPTVKERSMKCVGPSLNVAYVFRNWFLGIYTHFLPDGLPVIAWLREIMPANATLVLAKHPMSEQIIDFVDAKFAAKHIHWAGFGEVLCAAEAHLLIYPPMPWRELGLLQRLRSWIRPPVPTPLGHNSSLEAVTVFYSRASAGSVHHGRYMVKEHEEAILALIHTSMQAVLKGVHSRLVVYDGHLHNGSSMPIAKQAELFQSASFVIGPHGGGLANIVWLPNLRPYLRHSTLLAGTRSSDVEHNCDDRPRVLEIICGTRSNSVQDHCPYGRSFYNIFATVFWAEYHNVLFAANSSATATWVQFDELALALETFYR